MRFIVTFLLIFPLLSGCLTVAETSSNKSILPNIREINLIEMGAGRHNLQIRGNVYTQQKHLREQYMREVQAICGNGYEIEDLETSDITNMGHKKPVLEGTFKCK